MMTSYKSKFNKLFYTICTVLCPWCEVCELVSGRWNLTNVRQTTAKDILYIYHRYCVKE